MLPVAAIKSQHIPILKKITGKENKEKGVRNKVNIMYFSDLCVHAQACVGVYLYMYRCVHYVFWSIQFTRVPYTLEHIYTMTQHQEMRRSWQNTTTLKNQTHT